MEEKIHLSECKCLTWGPIIAGTLTALGLTFLLNLFSMAISLTAFSTNNQGVQTLAFGGLIATALGIVASMFASGWLAGYLGNRYCNKRHLGALYGFLVWCLALIIMVFLAEHIQTYITLYSHFISGSTVTEAPITKEATTLTSQLSLPNKIIISTYIIFVLFFLGAFSSSLGGHCGMVYVNKDERKL